MTTVWIDDPLATSTDSTTRSLNPFATTVAGHGERCGHGQHTGTTECADADLPRCRTCGQPVGSWATDRLTGLLNRWGWDDEAPVAFRRARRRREDIALMLIDLDSFKAINDELGHPVGDRVLQEAADVLLCSTRRRDVVSRYGGDEFIILLPGTSVDDAVGTADRILGGIRTRRIEVMTGSNTTARLEGLTASIGVAAYVPKCDDTLADLLGNTDAALRRAKADGCGQMRLHDPSKPSIHIGADGDNTQQRPTRPSRSPSLIQERTSADRSEDLRDLLNLRHLTNSDWMPDVLRVLAEGPKHHGDLLAAIRSSEVIDEWSGRDRNIQASILNRTLRRLTDNGFVHRYEEPGVWPRSVRYELSQAAQEWLSEIMPAVSRWCDRHSELILRAQQHRKGNLYLKAADGRSERAPL